MIIISRFDPDLVKKNCLIKHFFWSPLENFPYVILGCPNGITWGADDSLQKRREHERGARGLRFALVLAFRARALVSRWLGDDFTPTQANQNIIDCTALVHRRAGLFVLVCLFHVFIPQCLLETSHGLWKTG